MAMKSAKISMLVACFAMVLFLGEACAYSGPFEFGSKVEAGDNDIGRLLYNFSQEPVVVYWDVDSDGYDSADPVYLHLADITALIGTGDVRLTRYGNYMPGSKVRQTDDDLGRTFSLFPSGAGIVYTDLSGALGYSLGDGVYFSTGALPEIGEGNIRLTPFSNMAAGTVVCDADPDAGRQALPLPQMIRFYNENGDEEPDGTPIYDLPDDVYIDISLDDTSAYGFVVVNDVRLSV